jgi:eukaryotic-like serine/threonine-protein kinase
MRGSSEAAGGHARNAGSGAVAAVARTTTLAVLPKFPPREYIDPVNPPTGIQAALADRYTLERELGAGGMATVYLARDIKHDRDVAIKVLREDLSASLGKERFLREIRVAAGLQHPHILPLYDSGEADGRLFYVMPFVDGLSLRQKLEKERELPITDAVRILRDVADALSEAHKHGVVHRDLKPENVMLRGRHALVTDFGVAKALSEATGKQSLTTVGIAIGTPTYMAPEQAVADPLVDHRADIYAFGVLAYELLAGRPPFTGLTQQQILAAHLTSMAEPVTRHRAVPPGLATLVMRCLEKKPADRWQSAEELIPQLEAVMTPSGGMTPTSTPPLPVPTTVAWKKIGLVAAAVLVVVALALQPWKWSDGNARAAAADQLKNIAVLPFENIGGDTANAYFADGMTDELANALSRVPNLRVASRTSSYAFRDARARDIAAIRDALKVGALLEGTVSRSGEQLRVSARLTNTTDGVEIWSDAFVRSASDVFAVQNELARSIVSALAPALGGPVTTASADTTRGTHDPAAYDLYLRAQHLWYRRGAAALRQAATLFEQATERDPNFARAFAGIALAKVILVDYEGRAAAGIEAEIERAAAQAQALDSMLAEPLMAMGYFKHITGRPVEAEQYFKRAIALAPNSATAHQWYGIMLNNNNRNDDALRETQKAIELDPLSAIITSNYARALQGVGRSAEALSAMARAKALDPNNAAVRTNSAIAMVAAGRPQDALNDIEEAVRLGLAPEALLIPRVQALLQMRDSAKARAVVAQVAAALGDGANREPDMPTAYALIGDRDKALAALEHVVQARPLRMYSRDYYLSVSTWAPLRTDPRFVRAMDRLRQER